MTRSSFTEIGKDFLQAFGTPAVMLMTPEEMYAHVITFLSTASDDDSNQLALRWNEITQNLVEHEEANDWHSFIESLSSDEALKWAKIIGAQAERIKRANNNLMDALAYQLMAIFFRSSTMKDPISIATSNALSRMILETIS